MIAVDTSVLRRYFGGEIDHCTPILAEALAYQEALLPAIVLTEALSDRWLTDDEIDATLEIPLLPVYDGYWYRAGNLRRDLLATDRKAPAVDCLIAQACIDGDIPLLTYDGDFARFMELGLKLVIEP
jgi:predicted nucleic acid-binding protein